jgi:hypothetical protein
MYNSTGKLHLFVTKSLAIIPALTLLKKMQSPGTERYQQAPNKAAETALHDAERGPALKATATLGPVHGTSQANGQHRQWAAAAQLLRTLRAVTAPQLHA